MEKILIVGSGGREHALCKTLYRPLTRKLYCAPGNPGIAELAKLVPLAVDQIDELIKFCLLEKITLSIIGPEYPLSLGIVDKFRAAGILVFGPTQKAALMESSKTFAKEVMKAANVPTAEYQSFKEQKSASEFAQKLLTKSGQVVLKADGLAAGKGVVICSSENEISTALNFIFSDLKDACVLVEEFLTGVEASFIVATNGEDVAPLAPAHDYKRIFTGDKGANTGGMGTVSPTPHLSEAQAQWSLENIIHPVLAELRKRDIQYTGFLYAGLMIGAKGEINVIEFNCRLGDPETQVIFARLESDLFEIIKRLDAGDMAGYEVEWSEKSAVCVVLASRGYPEKPITGDEINGIEDLREVDVFHAGTKLSSEGKLLTAGGRVLNVVALGGDIESAREKAYQACEKISFSGVQYRKDIGI